MAVHMAFDVQLNRPAPGRIWHRNDFAAPDDSRQRLRNSERFNGLVSDVRKNIGRVLSVDAQIFKPRGRQRDRYARASGRFQRIKEPLVFSRDVFLLIALYSLVEIPGIAISLAERSNMVLRRFQDGLLGHVHKYLGFLVTDPVDMLR